MENSKELSIGEAGEVVFTVTERDTAKGLSFTAEDDFPDVFATAKMVGIMELAAARAMRRILEPHQLSVGVGVDIKHLAATPIGAEVRATAVYLGREGKLFKFRVEAFDAGGKIGEGEHTRAVVDTARLMDGAQKRTAAK